MAPKGSLMNCPWTKKTYRRRKDCFVMRIRKHCNPTYHLRIGFTVQRKQARLEEYLKKKLRHKPLPHFLSLQFIP